MGGLATAGLLARAGRSVILLDRASRAGGVCRPLEHQGYRFDVGVTFLCGLGPGGPLTRLCERLEVSLPLKGCDPAIQVALPHHRFGLWATSAAWWREVRREFSGDEAGWRALWAELEGLGEERDRALQELPPQPPAGWMDRLHDRPVLDRGRFASVSARAGPLLKRALVTPFRVTLARHGLGQASQRVLEALLWYLVVRDTAECSTLEAAGAFQQVRQGIATIPGGAMALVEALLGQFHRDGGHLRLETDVGRCLAKRGSVIGVVTREGEEIRARWVVADVPPPVLTGRLLPGTRGWFRRRPAVPGIWEPTRVVQMMVLVVPESMLPSELAGHCLVVRDPHRPAWDENLVCVRSAPAWDAGQAPAGLRCLTVTRFVSPRPDEEDGSAGADLLEALDQVVPGVAEATVYREMLPRSTLGDLWCRPAAAVRYAVERPDWPGGHGLPHRVGWPGLLVVGEHSLPGRLMSDVVEGAMQVVDLITQQA
jgi:phytoene dehydrogenase-like protein